MNNTKKIILITGCSSGFGLLTAARLSTSHHVFATMRDVQKQHDLLEEVSKRKGHVSILELDVTKPDSINSALKLLLEQHGTIDVLVNNAGFGIGGFFEDLTDDDIRQQMETNFFGVQNMTRAVLPIMRPKHSGKIINISSVAGISATPCFGAYNASKYALEGFSESLHHEMKLFNIDVSVINPGPFRTKIFEDNARYAARFFSTSSPYYAINQYLKMQVDNGIQKMNKNPEIVAKIVEKIINNPHPRFRYFTDSYGQLSYTLKRMLPFSLYGWIKRRFIYPSDGVLDQDPS